MKKIKKIISVMLVAVMAMAMSMTAFAASTDQNKPNYKDGAYKIYQIFTGDYSDGKLSNVKLGVNAKGYNAEQETKVTKEQLADLEKLYNEKENTDLAQLGNTNEGILEWVNLNSTPFIDGTPSVDSGYTLSDENGTITYSGIPAGYYLVSGEVTYSDGQKAETLYVVRVSDGTLTFKPKVDVPTVDKVIVEGNDKDKKNEASIGDVVNYEITGTLPSNLNDYKEYQYTFVDTLSNGLTFKNDIKVYLDNVSTDNEITKYFYAKEESEGNIVVSISNLLALNNVKGSNGESIYSIQPTSKIIVKYSATLNEKAVIAGTGNPNKVNLEYSNNPNQSGNGTTEPPSENPNEPVHPSGVTPESEVVTYTTELTITKRADDANGDFLPGTEFTLSGNGVNIVLVTGQTFVEDENGTYWKLNDGTYTTTAPNETEGDDDNSEDYDSTTTKYSIDTATKTIENANTHEVVGIVGKDGTVKFTGLGQGTYKITETKTLDGYNTIEPIDFTITWSSEKGFGVENVSDGVNINTKNSVLSTTIINKSGSLLPSTGGIGTTIFYIIGAIIVAGVIVILVTKRRVSRRV